MADLNSIFNTVDEDDPFGIGALLSPEAKLSDAIQEGNYQRAYAILRKLDEPLKGDTAADCLIHSFSRSERLFRAVLDHLSPEVRTGSMCASSENGAHMEVGGSLLTVAAALGGEVHVKALLARGFDVNAAAPDCVSVEPSFDIFGWGDRSLPYGPNYRFCAAPGNRVTVTRPDGRSFSIIGCTPLAAAIAAGNAFTLDPLLHAPGVWTTGSTAVCRAAALHAERRDFRDGWFLAWDGGEDGVCPEGTDFRGELGNVLFPHVNMQPECFADFCSPELLQMQYQSGQCTADDARRVLAVIDAQLHHHRAFPPHIARRQQAAGISVFASKLLLTAKHFPAVCREPARRDVFLLAYLHSLQADAPKKTLLNCWKKLCGKKRDVSACAPMIFSFQGAARKECLEALAEGGALYASADALSPDNTAQLRDMLQYLRIVPSPYRSGISGFAAAALALTPGVRTMQKLLASGALAGEPKEALLLAADTRLRPLILTTPFAVPAEVYDPARTADSFSHVVCTSDADMDSRRQSMLSGDMGEADCLLTLLDPRMFQNLYHLLSTSAVFPALDGVTPPALFCCAENPNALRAWMRMHPGYAGETICNDLQRGKSPLSRFVGPPLAAAAAAGRAENVRLLLEADPRTDVCCIAVRDGETLPCTPLWLALCFGQEEAARVLLSRGARLAPFGAPEGKAARALPPEGLALRERLRNDAGSPEAAV